MVNEADGLVLGLLRGMEGKLDSLRVDVREVKTRLGNLAGAGSVLSGRLEVIDHRLERVEDRVERVCDRLGTAKI